VKGATSEIWRKVSEGKTLESENPKRGASRASRKKTVRQAAKAVPDHALTVGSNPWILVHGTRLKSLGKPMRCDGKRFFVLVRRGYKLAPSRTRPRARTQVQAMRAPVAIPAFFELCRQRRSDISCRPAFSLLAMRVEVFAAMQMRKRRNLGRQAMPSTRERNSFLDAGTGQHPMRTAKKAVTL